MPVWQGTFQDRHGLEQVAFHNDGSIIGVRVRGVDFAGPDFDSLRPAPGQEADAAAFDLHNGELSSCTMCWTVPLTVVVGERSTAGTLDCRLLLAAPSRQRRYLAVELHLTLCFEDTRVPTRGPHGDFEGALDELHRELPAEVFLKTCISCAWSDYNPASALLFGAMSCFRADKDAYRSVRDKEDLLELLDADPPQVQETWLCPEYERRGRGTGTGYRGPFPYRLPA
jgi:hypothetical protein